MEPAARSDQHAMYIDTHFFQTQDLSRGVGSTEKGPRSGSGTL